MMMTIPSSFPIPLPIILPFPNLNVMSRRLERDTSVDRLSTGSRESMQSTQSEWLPGEKKKSKVGRWQARLYIPQFTLCPRVCLESWRMRWRRTETSRRSESLGAGATSAQQVCRASRVRVVRWALQVNSYSGRGKDIMHMNIQERIHAPYFPPLLIRSASKDRLNASKGEKEKPTPAQHNAKFDQMFDKAGTEPKSSTPGPTAPARPGASTVPRPAAAGSSSTLPRTYRRFWFWGLGIRWHNYYRYLAVRFFNIGSVHKKYTHLSLMRSRGGHSVYSLRGHIVCRAASVPH